jgi:NAD(P)-dependent dehydrogenase (short-subunit alcohol dehydrogenase family)
MTDIESQKEGSQKAAPKPCCVCTGKDCQVCCTCAWISINTLLMLAVLGTGIFGIYAVRMAYVEGLMTWASYTWAVFGILVGTIALECCLSAMFQCCCDSDF